MSGIYGFAAGDAAVTHITVEDVNGFRIRHGTDLKFHADIDGNLYLAGNLEVTGSGTLAAGTVTLDTDGVTIAIGSTALSNSQAYDWSGSGFGGTNKCGVFADESGSTRNVYVYNSASASGKTTGAYLQVASGAVGQSVAIVSDGSTVYALIRGTLRVDSNGDTIPEFDNTYHCGVPSKRWLDVYAVNGTIQTSDAEMKDDVGPSDLGKDFLAALQPKAWKWKDSPDDRPHYGFTAQDVAATLGAKKFGGLYHDDAGRPTGLNYASFIAPLVSGWQHHEARIAEQAATIAALEQRIAALEGR